MNKIFLVSMTKKNDKNGKPFVSLKLRAQNLLLANTIVTANYFNTVEEFEKLKPGDFVGNGEVDMVYVNDTLPDGTAITKRFIVRMAYETALQAAQRQNIKNIDMSKYTATADNTVAEEPEPAGEIAA